jgi:hypothetical protein
LSRVQSKSRLCGEVLLDEQPLCGKIISRHEAPGRMKASAP